MPPKYKMHKSTGKVKAFATVMQPSMPSSSQETEHDVNTEAVQQFENELFWCIQQLNAGLRSGKISEKQVQEYTKALNTLTSSAAPVIRKRQVMRLAFGDYRSLMAAEDSKFRSVKKVKVTPVAPSRSSVFFKKSIFAQKNGSGFRFNFEDPSSVDISEQVSNITIDNEATTDSNGIIDTEAKDKLVTNDFHFVPSGNSFKFNFTVDNND